MTTAAMTTTMTCKQHHHSKQCQGEWANSCNHLPHRGMTTMMMMIRTVQMIRSHKCRWGVARGLGG